MYSSNKPGSASCICTTVKKLSRVLVRAYDDALAESGINVTQLAVVRCIQRRAGEPLTRVAEELEMDRTSLYRAIAPMVRDGWIQTNPGSDARTRAAKVTRKGEKVLALAGGCWDAMQERLIDAFGRDSWMSLAGEIRRLAECTEAGGPGKKNGYPG